MISTVLRGVTALIIAGLLASVIFYRYEASKAEHNAAVLHDQNVVWENVHKSDQATLQRISEFRKADENAFSQLLANQNAILAQSAETTTAIDKLRIKDAQVDKYMREPIPVPLRNILNGLRDQAAADCGNKNNRCQAAKAAN